LAKQLLEVTALDPGGGGYDQRYGWGRVDAFAAVNAAVNYVQPPDTTAPSVAMSAPLDGASVAGTAVISISASDDVGVVKIDLYVDGVYFASDTAVPYSFALDTTTLPNGTHTLYALAADAAGNTASSAPISVMTANTPPDTTAPTLSISSPASGATVSGIATVSASASDNVGVAKVELFVDGTLYATDTAAPYSFAWNTAQASNGSHTLLVVGTDAAGNAGSITQTVVVSNNHAPVAANDVYTAPYRPKSSYTAQVFSVLANDSDADGNLNPASVKLVSAPNKGGSVTVKSNGAVSYTPKQGYRGLEIFSYSVKDSLGATSNTATVTVNVQ
jgi:hypothetical protein